MAILNTNFTNPIQNIIFQSPIANSFLKQQNILDFKKSGTSSIFENQANNTSQTTSKNNSNLTRSLTSAGVDALSSTITGKINDMFGDSELGRSMGTLFSQGVSSAGNTMASNLTKNIGLTNGLAQDSLSSIAGTGAGIAANYIGQGINAIGGDSRLSRGIGQGIATGLGAIGGQTLSNLIKTGTASNTLTDSIKAIKTFKQAKDALNLAEKAGGSIKTAQTAFDAAKSAKLAALANLGGLGMSMVGTGLQAATGPSKEYAGKYGNITSTLDTAYDVVSTAANAFGPVGSLVSGAMALNKGLSNIFGSTDGMTKTDAILGSAFMGAPVKWLNMAGASKTGTFNNQSWQNSSKASSFMGNAFGDLNDKFDKAREEAGKTYGTFSQGAKRDAQRNIDFANQAWNQILAMADQNELQNIRSQYMSSINNQRYAQQIGGAWQPVYRGRQGMKIFNNATNHNIGMRLLSAAALIDNKAMILCSVVD